MPNERIKNEMILAGVSINELAEYLGKTEQKPVELLNTELVSCRTTRSCWRSRKS